jgi:hypothetical protein
MYMPRHRFVEMLEWCDNTEHNDVSSNILNAENKTRV